MIEKLLDEGKTLTLVKDGEHYVAQYIDKNNNKITEFDLSAEKAIGRIGFLARLQRMEDARIVEDTTKIDKTKFIELYGTSPISWMMLIEAIKSTNSILMKEKKGNTTKIWVRKKDILRICNKRIFSDRFGIGKKKWITLKEIV